MSADSPDQEPIPQSSQIEDDSTPSFGGWFSSLVQSAKDTVNKSADTLESIKRDLSEFKDAVQSDTTSMVYSTASMVKTTITEIGNTVNEIGSLGTSELEQEIEQGDALKIETDQQQQSNIDPNLEDDINESSAFNLEAINSWTNILTDKAKTTLTMVKDTLVDSIFINRDFLIDELEDEPYVIKNDQIIAIKNWKEMLHKLQIDPNTYYRESNGPPEDFDLWLTKFNLMNYQKQMEYLLENVPEIKKYHSDLVPQALSDSDFWHRYYYMVYQLKEEQKRLIFESNDEATDNAVDKKEVSSVNIKYLTEESSAKETKTDNESKISRSSTEDWEKMDNSNSLENATSKEIDKSSSDDDRDWVKCE